MCHPPPLFLWAFQSYQNHLIKICLFLGLYFAENFSVWMRFTSKLVPAVLQPLNQQDLGLCPTGKDSPGPLGLEL